MDLYMKAGSVLVYGAIFCIVVYYVSIEVQLSEDIKAVFRDRTETHVLDVRMTEREFDVEKRAFEQFVIGQQQDHTIILCNEGTQRFSDRTLDALLIEFDYALTSGLESGVSVAGEATLRYIKNDPDVSEGDCNAIDVSGTAGYRIEDVKNFVRKNHSARTIRVLRMVEPDGSLILYCKGV